jgi:hypothetical protein
MCGECSSDKTTLSCEEANSTNNDTECGLRYLYCLRPYGSPPMNVPLKPQAPLTPADSFTFEEGFVVVGGSGNFWNRSNPFTLELQQWPVSN